MDLKVNDVEWAGLGAEERSRIESIISGYFKGARIIPDKNTLASGMTVGAASNPFCRIACTALETAAVAACGALTNPIAIAICVAAAHEAGEECRRNC